eukprot:169501_1
MRNKIVPSLIKEDEFWKRYFYLVQREKKKKQKDKKDEKEKVDEKEKEKEDSNSKEEEEGYQVLLHKPLIWLYKIEATAWRGRNNKCELWSLRNPIWSGRLLIVAYNHGKEIIFKFLEKDGKIFIKSTKN